MNSRGAPVRLSGRLICVDLHEAGIVERHLPAHIALTHAEPGCLSFEVNQTENPLVWEVEERFVDAAAFRFHQDRVAASEWGSATCGIARQYEISGLDAPSQ